MRVLLDECLPRRLKRELPGHGVVTVPEMGWRGTKNGELLRLASPAFDVFVTVDQGVVHQQSLRLAGIAVIVLVAPSNRFEVPRPLMSEVLRLARVYPAGRVRSRGELTTRLRSGSRGTPAW